MSRVTRAPCADMPPVRAASTRLKFIQTPFLLSAPQFDKWQLKYDVRLRVPLLAER